MVYKTAQTNLKRDFAESGLLICEARFVAQTACLFYMFCSLPEAFGRIEVMEPVGIDSF
jgi:hypothetical protein